jgi:hypothetical protein
MDLSMDSLSSSPALSRAGSFGTGASMDNPSKHSTKVRDSSLSPDLDVYDEHLVKGPTALMLLLVLVYLVKSVGSLRTLSPLFSEYTWLSYNTGKTGLTRA